MSGSHLAYYRDVWYSTDGINWTQATGSAPWQIRSNHVTVVFDGKMWLLGGWQGDATAGGGTKNDVWYSTDGANWTQVTSSAPWGRRTSHSAVVHDGKIWIV